ncbi:MAG TPA: glycogen debranching enzyme, partial [Mycobacteriales bacterium]|nr:glycogen debranching enzyme [Mycobacteriales bacterium]
RGDWDAGFGKSLAVFLNGEQIAERGLRGEQVTDDSFLVCFNAHDGALDFVTPDGEYAKSWVIELDTETPTGASQYENGEVAGGASVTVAPRSVVVLRRQA